MGTVFARKGVFWASVLVAPGLGIGVYQWRQSQKAPLLQCEGKKDPTTEEETFFRSIGRSFEEAKASIQGFDTNDWIPSYYQNLPEWVDRLKKEFMMGEGSLVDEIWQDSRNSDKNPEITSPATVRLSQNLCDEELQFQKNRIRFTKKALAKYLGLSEKDIDSRDVPTVSIACSGGGLRAMVGSVGYMRCLQQDGIFDIATYMAGVSGSCWGYSLFMTLAERDWNKLAQHMKARLHTHIAYPPPLLKLLTEPPTHKYLLTGILEKLRMGHNEVGLVDIYGTMLASRLLVPADEVSVNYDDLKLSTQRKYCDGMQPLPLYTVVHHETKEENGEILTQEDARKESNRNFSWFEISPFEFGSEDLTAWIPTWALGRKFERGRSIDPATPELRTSILFGIFGSAMCATLSHYYKEIRPIIPKYGIFTSLDNTIMEQDEKLLGVHPLEPAAVPNIVKGMSNLPSTSPKSLRTEPELQLMDAGMSNNLPFYPILRREVDIILAIDCSADIVTTPWFERADGYARRKGISAWPVGAGWKQQASSKQAPSDENNMEQHLDKSLSEVDKQQVATSQDDEYPLGPCTIWVGSRQLGESGAEKLEDDSTLTLHNDGIAVVYLPLIPHKDMKGLHPDKTPWLSTWNFEYTPDQIDQVMTLASKNYNEGRDQIRSLVRAVYERKKAQRLSSH